MKRSFVLLGTGLLFIVLLSSTVSAYVPGDTVSIRLPSSGYGVSVGLEPKYYRYTLYNPAGDVKYQEDHDLVYLHDLGFGLGWTFFDEYNLKIPAFASEGTWTISGRLHSAAALVIEVPSPFPHEKEFNVESTDLLTNLLAPSYFTFSTGITGGRFNFALPFSIHLLVIFIALIVAVLLFVYYLVRKPRHMLRRNKDGKKK